MNQEIHPQYEYEIVDDSMTFKELFKMLYGYRYVFLLICSISLVLGIVYLMFFTIPVYRASGELMLKPTQQSIFNRYETWVSDQQQNTRVNDSLIRIRGAAITDSVVVKTRSFAHILLEKKYLDKIRYFSATPPAKALFLHVFKSVSPQKNNDFFIIDDDGNKCGSGSFNKLCTTKLFSLTLSDMNGIDSFDVILEPITTARNRISKNFELLNYRDTNVIQFSYNSPDPTVSKALVNTYMREFSYRNLMDKREKAVALKTFINNQLHIISNQLDSAEKEFLNFRMDTGVVSLDEQTTQYLTLLGFLEEKRIDYQFKLSEAQTSKEKNETILRGAPEFEMFSRYASSPFLQENSILNELYSKIAELQIENSRLAAEFNPSHPSVVKSIAEYNAAKAQLDEEIKIRVDNITKGADPLYKPIMEKQLVNIVNIEVNKRLLKQVKSEIRNIEDDLNKLPQAEKDQAQIQRNLNINQQTYDQLRTKLQEAKIMEGSTINDVEIINWAEEPQKPISPSRVKIILASMFGGILLSLITVTIKEFFTKSFSNVDQLEKELNVPVISVIPRLPYLRKDGRSIVASPAKSGDKESSQVTELLANPTYSGDKASYHITELFRSAFVNSLLIRHDKDSQTFVVTSALPKEGKSVITANIGFAAAHIGNKVLIIDCDFRNPVQHKIFNIPNEKGLSELLDETPSNGISLTKYPNLCVCTPGNINKDNFHSKFINRNSFSKKMKTLEKYFDYIFIDTPPVHVYSDTSLITSFFQNVLFVMKFDTNKDAVQQAIKSVNSSKTRVQGIIVNDMHTSYFSGKTYSSYANTYYKGYGY